MPIERDMGTIKHMRHTTNVSPTYSSNRKPNTTSKCSPVQSHCICIVLNFYFASFRIAKDVVMRMFPAMRLGMGGRDAAVEFDSDNSRAIGLIYIGQRATIVYCVVSLSGCLSVLLVSPSPYP